MIRFIILLLFINASIAFEQTINFSGTESVSISADNIAKKLRMVTFGIDYDYSDEHTTRSFGINAEYGHLYTEEPMLGINRSNEFYGFSIDFRLRTHLEWSYVEPVIYTKLGLLLFENNVPYYSGVHYNWLITWGVAGVVDLTDVASINCGIEFNHISNAQEYNVDVDCYCIKTGVSFTF